MFTFPFFLLQDSSAVGGQRRQRGGPGPPQRARQAVQRSDGAAERTADRPGRIGGRKSRSLYVETGFTSQVESEALIK